ncbi:MAG TPA: DUF983 domain-containing protein [Niabella sp.]|nr:DUF983 domain-containing protein [Niabella sp.]HQW14442.1 DUF983 domain-containing protein [Niabella sp.]HQX19857.1 DUF983 domain-containing protein [Niabella sp.]HQX40684.1 DUF983 domain-containing protein [Niabella sp.]HRB07732.1 DUF983 domain-containing protein [Niabella sp.]
MDKETTIAKRSLLSTVLGCYCPRCREGKIFQNPFSFKYGSSLLKMNKTCAICSQPTELEVGFYYGTGYISYMISFALTVATAVAWWVIIGFSASDNRFIYWLIFNTLLLILLQPWLMRLSRSLWLSGFVKYDPYWKENAPEDVSEKLNEEQGDNW